MKKALATCTVLLLMAALAFGAEDRNHKKPASAHSKAPAHKVVAKTPARKGKGRTQTASKGKKNGLKKLAFWQHKKQQKGRS